VAAVGTVTVKVADLPEVVEVIEKLQQMQDGIRRMTVLAGQDHGCDGEGLSICCSRCDEIERIGQSLLISKPVCCGEEMWEMATRDEKQIFECQVCQRTLPRNGSSVG